MMKVALLIVITIFIPTIILAQSCLPDGITFNTQTQIDSFQILYPNCSEIEGDVEINGNDITNLSGLNVLNSIGGDLIIGSPFYYNPNLESLIGLDNIITIGGELSIGFNERLTNLSGLDNLMSIGGDLTIYGNDSLINLLGLENLVTLDGRLSIGTNENLGVYYGNPALINLTGLDNLSYIGNNIYILCNNSLINLDGLQGLTSILGDLWINGYDDSQASLINLTGLDNVTSIGGDLTIIENTAITNLTGLNNLSSIGGKIFIDYAPALSSLFGLNNLTSLDGGLQIRFNTSLTSLAGLDNIDAGSISYLEITGNTSLSTCEVQSVCDYISSPGASVGIDNNATGCNDESEVEDACESVYIEEFNNLQDVITYPNPTQSSITIELPTQPSRNTTLTISNTNGQQLITQPITESQTEINISHLPAGIYIVKVWNDKDVMVQKVIKQ